MKKILILLIGLFLAFTGSSQPCLPQGITFSTQSQIDNFQIDYPGCTQIQGRVEIQGSGITNLNGLNVLTSVGADLVIDQNSVLTDLTGLNGLLTIGGNLKICANDVLKNLSGLNSLTSINGNLMIWSNALLDSITGLENLTFIAGGLDIGIEGQSHPFGNPSLVSLSGLKALTASGWDLYISLNNSLINLTGLENLTSIGRGIIIEGNLVLNTLTGLDNINAATIKSLGIQYNISLSNCAVQSICDYLANPNGPIIIQNNATGCNSQAEVDTACQYLSVGNLVCEDTFSIYPNPTSDFITIEISTIQTQIHLSIMNLNCQQLITRQISEPKTQIDISNLPSGVYFVRLTGEKIVQVGKFIKQ